jgi:oxygen-independent coproporphyrinogen-3 oxidase
MPVAADGVLPKPTEEPDDADRHTEDVMLRLRLRHRLRACSPMPRRAPTWPTTDVAAPCRPMVLTDRGRLLADAVVIC